MLLHRLLSDRRTSGRALALGLAAVGTLAMNARLTAQQPAPTTSYTVGDDAKVSGWIVSRRGDEFLVRDETTHQLSWVSITGTTEIESKSGLLDLERKKKDATSLVPGLLIKVKGIGGPQGNLVAYEISFHGRALRTAKQISAGEVELKAQQRQTAAIAAANRDSIAAVTARGRDTIAAMAARSRDSLAAMEKRLSNLDNYDQKFMSSVRFATGSTELSAEAKQALDDLVSKSTALDGFVIEVSGFADSTGSAAFNQVLSTRRAQAVIAYLTDAHSIPLRRIATPSGLGAARPIGSNSTADGRAQNRRVEVRVLTNRGIKPSPQD